MDLQHTVVAQKLLIQDTTGPFLGYVRDPDTAYPETIAF
jgi:hypothetical protein